MDAAGKIQSNRTFVFFLNLQCDKSECYLQTIFLFVYLLFINIITPQVGATHEYSLELLLMHAKNIYVGRC